ncbi:hypothetical protein GCM10023065_22190 [Microbacterium laevaniformans]|uniref:DUF2332 domain-containing protein n=1 Tax=Microbacterium laevaniformans TaxID=36807 RepID=UPI001955F838|nr:DUF2332 domain-containing protein [Microbacterium laevaniformans]MBM7753177.1 hypothetical protein [Microbacterium laevaniformans]GLJ65293.1 hypothetical protein GCM10017578_21820 [Microbacterium laevaniformans]
MSSLPESVSARYGRFARDEAPGRSALYGEWAAGVAADAAAQEVLGRIAPSHRQPPLVFAAARLLGSGESGYPEWREWVLAHGDELVAECTARSLQTNEPLRCAALLPALAGIDGPIALLEVGASAGLCLYPDRYSYRYRGVAGEIAHDPLDGVSAVVLESELRGQHVPPLRHPEIVWRAGIDLAPLDPADPATEAWLTALVWPGETGPADRVRSALRITAADPPLMFAGDGVDQLAHAVAAAPPEATLVVQTPGVLAHLGWHARHALIEQVSVVGRWITLDAPSLHEGWRGGRIASNAPAEGFALARDGVVLAHADPLGRWLEWRPGERAARG